MPRFPSALSLALALVLGAGEGGSWAGSRTGSAPPLGARRPAVAQRPVVAQRPAAQPQAGTVRRPAESSRAAKAPKSPPSAAKARSSSPASAAARAAEVDRHPRAALKEAEAALAALRGDASRRRYRHHWLNVAHKLDRISRKAPRHALAPEALALAAGAYAELARLSRLPDDAADARRRYRTLVEEWPRHPLADDAALALLSPGLAGAVDPELARSLRRVPESARDGRAALGAALARAGVPTEEVRAVAELPPRPRPDGRRAGPQEKAGAAEAPRAAEPSAHGPAGEAAASLGRIARATQRLLAERAAARPGGPLAGDAGVAASVDPPSEGSAGLAGQDSARGRRLSPHRPREELTPALQDRLGTHGPDDVEEHETSPLTALSERLRDVRVGERAPAAVSEDARLRLRAHAKEERDAELTLAQQLGLKVRRVVVDPGHGGHDTGAIGPGGTYEKDVALEISLKLAERLEALGLEVLLTRDDDRFVKLEERSAIANKAHGDLFISIHCNAAPSKRLRGVETYTLNLASSRYAKRLAARENATSERGIGDLQFILADLATKANTGESVRLAQRVQEDLVRTLSGRYANIVDLGHKEALFFVLLGARMPALLLETSFISNPEEEQRLASEAYQGAVADSVARSLSDFLEARARLASAE